MNMPVLTGTAERAFRQLQTAARTGVACAPVRDLIGGAAAVDSAYAVQSALVAARVAAGARIVGRKIGLTAPVVQQQFGIDQPDYGVLTADMEVAPDGVIPVGATLQPRCEAEIAFVLSRDLPHVDPGMAEVISAVDYLLPAIEIVDSRIAGWDITVADTIADNASSGLFILGQDRRCLRDVDLYACGMVMECRGGEVSTGAGAACMGSPLNALRWLAAEMARRGMPLRAGEVVLSGALGPMVAARPGDSFDVRINGLGAVSVRFAPKGEHHGD